MNRLLQRVGHRFNGTGQPHGRHAGDPDERRFLLWLLTAWTALQGILLLVTTGDVARALAAGAREPSARELLGVQALVLAAVYCWLALSGSRAGRLFLLPLVSQALLAAALFAGMLAGDRSFGSAVVPFGAALLFTVALAAFQLAGSPYTESARMPERTARAPAADFSENAATERLDSAHRPVRPVEPLPPPTEGGDSVLGI